MKNTPFTQKHIDLGAKMAEFAGHNMPIVYTSINDVTQQIIVNADTERHAAQAVIDYARAESAEQVDTGITVITLLVPEPGQVIDWDRLHRTHFDAYDLRYPDDPDVVGEGDE